jgi:addiction module antidote protein, HigA family
MAVKTTKFPHPGGVLLREFLEPMGISQYRLSLATKISHSTITMIIQGKRGISVENSIKIGKALGTGPELWLNMQKTYDLRSALNSHKTDFDNIECLLTA